jgi:hypothetical protein
METLLPTTPVKKSAAAKAKEAVAEMIVKEHAKKKGPTMAQFMRNPRPLMRGGRDVG